MSREDEIAVSKIMEEREKLEVERKERIERLKKQKAEIEAKAPAAPASVPPTSLQQ